MRNYPNTNKHFYQSQKGNRYQRTYKSPSLNIDDYLNVNPSYSNKQPNDWDNNYNYTSYQDNNPNMRGYHNRNYYNNGPSQRYNNNQYSKYEKDSNDLTHSNYSSFNYIDENIPNPKHNNNNYNNEDSYNKKQMNTSSNNINHNNHNSKYQVRHKPLKVAKSLTDITGDNKNSNTIEFNLKRNFPSKEEVLRVKFNLGKEIKEVVVYKNDDCFQIAKALVDQNSLHKSMIKPIAIKLNYSLEKITEILMGKVSSEEEDLLENVRNIAMKNEVKGKDDEDESENNNVQEKDSG